VEITVETTGMAVGRVRIEESGDAGRVYCLSSHRRTLTETDIVNFVNLVGLHEPPFIDMEWVQKRMPGQHKQRFAPAPLLVSLGMGLVATTVSEVVNAIAADAGMGPFHGMVGLEAKVRAPVFPGDTLRVELEGRVDRKTRRGQTLVDLKHRLLNQRDEEVVVFTEKLLFEPAPS
jgi:acyl dehydratase